MNIQKSIIKNSVQLILKFSAYLARHEKLSSVTGVVMTGLARATIRLKGIRPAENLADLGRQWQKGFPSAKQVPIIDVTDTTVMAEIHTPCPLRGTNDVEACYRMMQYDREVVSRAGGQFIVLQSQASPGNSYCAVAMRKKGVNVDDLKPAHITAGTDG